MKKAYFFILMVMFTVFVNASMQPDRVWDANHDAKEILVGEVLGVQTINVSNCFENRLFEFKIDQVLTSKTGLKVADNVQVPFSYLINTQECAVAGGSFADINLTSPVKFK